MDLNTIIGGTLAFLLVLVSMAMGPGGVMIFVHVGSLIIVGVFTTVVTLAIIFVAKMIVPLRVDKETETNGLDLAVHGERAYELNS